MKLKLDENLSHYLKPRLAALEHDVRTTADEGLLSQPDTAVAVAAGVEGRMLLTLDLEFLRKYPPGAHPGMIVFRPRSLGPLFVNRVIEAFVRDTDLAPLAGCVIVVDPSRVRIRRPTTDSK